MNTNIHFDKTQCQKKVKAWHEAVLTLKACVQGGRQEWFQIPEGLIALSNSINLLVIETSGSS